MLVCLCVCVSSLGLGVYQRGMEYCMNLLHEGRWVHVFPEGTTEILFNHYKLLLDFWFLVSKSILHSPGYISCYYHDLVKARTLHRYMQSY